MRKSILVLSTIVIALAANPFNAIAQSRYVKTSAPLTTAEKKLYFTKKQQERDRKEQLERLRAQPLLLCLPRWVERNELNVYRLRCK